jgi:predicted GNAT family acetyltransferase
MTHVLDHPALQSLTSHHRALAEGGPRAFRYQPDVAPFLAAVDNSVDSLNAMAELLVPDRTAIIVQATRGALPPGAVVEVAAEGVQMVADELAPPAISLEYSELAADDAPEMVALAALTRPGPFLARTSCLGGYIGIRDKGRLVAMAGERFHLPGYAEVSAVCTHPDYRGRGYAGYLTLVVAARIAARAETPFLHTFASNTNAIRLYETLGFVHRTNMSVLLCHGA